MRLTALLCCHAPTQLPGRLLLDSIAADVPQQPGLSFIIGRGSLRLLEGSSTSGGQPAVTVVEYSSAEQAEQVGLARELAGGSAPGLLGRCCQLPCRGQAGKCISGVQQLCWWPDDALMVA